MELSNEIISVNIENNSLLYKLVLKAVSDNIIVELIEQDLFSGIKYQNKLNIETLKELNPFFNQFTKIERVVNMFKKFFQSNKINIENVENNSISKVNIFFINPIDEEEKIYFP